MKMKTEPGIAWIPPSEAKRRIDTIPLPKKLKSRFLHEVIVWQSNSGTEWTVSRLKSFKDCLTNSWSDGGVLSFKPEWFRTTPSGMLSGVWGQLWHQAMSSSSSFKAVLFMVNIYTGCYRTEVTKGVLEEMVESIESRPPVRIPRRSSTVPSRGDAYRALRNLGWADALKVYERPAPLNVVLPGKESHIVRLPDDTLQLANLPMMPMRSVELVRDALGVRGYVGGNYMTESVIGSIHISHEPGLKTRYFAAPNLVVQRALEPLKNSLLGFLARVPWDCTLNQRKADKEILSHLAAGRKVHSVDLSKATDAFPWGWQKVVLRALCGNTKAHAAADLVETSVESCAWEFPDGSLRMFKAGQPLGLGPSFPMFTLSHGVLLYVLNGYKWDRKFYVLGDDVVIFDCSLAAKYRKVLHRWGVGVSDAKSFASERLAQFAGVTYTTKESFWVPKWRPLTRSNLLDSEAWWYPGLTRGMPDHSVIQRVLSLPEPYGIGRNPKGIPLSERFDAHVADELIGREQRRVERSIPRATRPDIHRLVDLCKKAGVSQATLLDYVNYACGTSQWSESYPEWFARRRPTGRPWPALLRPLFHGTDVPGFPELRSRSVRFDPYSVGSLQAWKQVFRRVDSAKASVEVD